MSFAGLSTSCSGGRGVPMSGPPSYLHRHTTRICRPVGGRTVSGRLPLVHACTLVCRTWWPATSHLSSGQVSWSPSCTCPPPTLLWLLAFPRRFVEHYSRPRHMAALSPCFHLRLCRGWPGRLLLCFRGCRSVPGHSEFQL